MHLLAHLVLALCFALPVRAAVAEDRAFTSMLAELGISTINRIVVEDHTLSDESFAYTTITKADTLLRITDLLSALNADGTVWKDIEVKSEQTVIVLHDDDKISRFTIYNKSFIRSLLSINGSFHLGNSDSEHELLRLLQLKNEAAVPREGLEPSTVVYALVENAQFALASGTEEVAAVKVAINGSYFDLNGAAVGLIRHNGEDASDLGGEKLSGKVVIDKGRLHLLWRDYQQSGETIFRAGPFVIDPGHVMGIRRNVKERFNRSIVALLSDGRVGLFHFKAVDLHEAATFLMAFEPQIERAINLDGGPSALFISADISIPPQVKIPNRLIQQQSK